MANPNPSIEAHDAFQVTVNGVWAEVISGRLSDDDGWSAISDALTELREELKPAEPALNEHKWQAVAVQNGREVSDYGKASRADSEAFAEMLRAEFPAATVSVVPARY